MKESGKETNENSYVDMLRFVMVSENLNCEFIPFVWTKWSFKSHVF